MMVREIIGKKYFGELRIRPARNSGGKAGKGLNKTSTLQVIDYVGDGQYRVLKHFRYTVNDEDSYRKAQDKARVFLEKCAPYD